MSTGAAGSEAVVPVLALGPGVVVTSLDIALIITIALVIHELRKGNE